jgi:D-sedoheptulose 7-phosphate isomerase
MDFKQYTQKYLSTLSLLNTDEIEKFIDLLVDAYNKRTMVFVIGNGGSASNASHFAQDLAKGTRATSNQTKRLRALSLTDNMAFVTAQGNDEGYNTIFEQQLRTLANRGDMVIAISGSGNSPNVLEAIDWANKNGLVTLGVTGFDGGKLKKTAQYSVNVPVSDMRTAESVHTVIFHYVVHQLIERFK